MRAQSMEYFIMSRYLTFDAYGIADDQRGFGKIKRLPCDYLTAANGDIYIRFDAKERCFIRRVRNTDIGVAFGLWADRESLTYSPENSQIEV